MGEPRRSFRISIIRLAHYPSGLYFEILFSQGFLKSINYLPGPAGSKAYGQVNFWNDVMRNAEAWAHALKRELSAPDLWASIQTEREFMSGGPATTTNSAFDKNEKEQISRSLNEIRGFLENTQKLSEGQMAIVSSRLADLEDAANRVGRKDWIAIAYGTLVNIVVSAALTTEQAQAFFHFAASSLKWMMTAVKALT